MNGIPVLHVEADCIARAWELSLIELYQQGRNLKTEYDKPADPPSKDATMIITITDPLREPMIHRDFPGRPGRVAGIRHGGLRRHQGSPRARPE